MSPSAPVRGGSRDAASGLRLATNVSALPRVPAFPGLKDSPIKPGQIPNGILNADVGEGEVSLDVCTATHCEVMWKANLQFLIARDEVYGLGEGWEVAV